jgi:ABC-type sugar transport systems, permease components
LENDKVFIRIYFCVPLKYDSLPGSGLVIEPKNPGPNLFRTIMITPLVVPVASVFLVWQAFFDLNGVLNSLIHALGYPPVDWMKTD